MASFTLEDQTGAVRVVAFPDVFERFERSLADGAAVLAAAMPRASDGEHVELALEEATPLEGIEARKAVALRVELDLCRCAAREELAALQELFLRHEGRVQLRLRLVGPTWSAELVPTRVMGVDRVRLIPALTPPRSRPHRVRFRLKPRLAVLRAGVDGAAARSRAAGGAAGSAGLAGAARVGARTLPAGRGCGWTDWPRQTEAMPAAGPRSGGPHAGPLAPRAGSHVQAGRRGRFMRRSRHPATARGTRKESFR